MRKNLDQVMVEQGWEGKSNMKILDLGTDRSAHPLDRPKLSQNSIRARLQPMGTSLEEPDLWRNLYFNSPVFSSRWGSVQPQPVPERSHVQG